MQQDPWEHLEWESVTFQAFVDHVADLLAETTWQENIQYSGKDSQLPIYLFSYHFYESQQRHNNSLGSLILKNNGQRCWTSPCCQFIAKNKQSCRMERILFVRLLLSKR